MSNMILERRLEIQARQVLGALSWRDGSLKDVARTLLGESLQDVKKEELTREFSYNEEEDVLEYRLDSGTMEAFRQMRPLPAMEAVSNAAEEMIERYDTPHIRMVTDSGEEIELAREQKYTAGFGDQWDLLEEHGPYEPGKLEDGKEEILKQQTREYVASRASTQARIWANSQDRYSE